MVAKLARSGGPMHQASSSCARTGLASFSSAYWIEPVMPGFGSVRVPSRSKKMVSIVFSVAHDLIGKPVPTFPDHALSVGIARRQVARDFHALVDVAAHCDGRGRRAGAVGLLKAVIAAVE